MNKKRKKPGRKPKPAAEKESKRVGLNFTPGEYREVERQAREAGLPVATYLKECWRKARQ